MCEPDCLRCPTSFDLNESDNGEIGRILYVCPTDGAGRIDFEPLFEARFVEYVGAMFDGHGRRIVVVQTDRTLFRSWGLNHATLARTSYRYAKFEKVAVRKD